MSFDRFFYPEDVSYTDKSERNFARNSLIFNVTEDILVFMEQNEISKKELSKRLGKTRAYVTQILDGTRNMTIGTFSDICFALGFKPEITLPIKTIESNRNAVWENYVNQLKELNELSQLKGTQRVINSILVTEDTKSRTASCNVGTWSKVNRLEAA